MCLSIVSSFYLGNDYKWHNTHCPKYKVLIGLTYMIEIGCGVRVSLRDLGAISDIVIQIVIGIHGFVEKILLILMP